MNRAFSLKSIDSITIVSGEINERKKRLLYFPDNHHHKTYLPEIHSPERSFPELAPF